jgi:hypothetical protein
MYKDHQRSAKWKINMFFSNKPPISGDSWRDSWVLNHKDGGQYGNMVDLEQHQTTRSDKNPSAKNTKILKRQPGKQACHRRDDLHLSTQKKTGW